jgi:alkanesulfonate monooxygenase SsuD/methylene tetrahydromethanopterin reductase-like flavin-dependent oxidoreductase (luciferase family)
MQGAVMEFGIFLPYQVFNLGEEQESLSDRMLDIAIAGDRAGVSYVWTPEHHFVHFLQSPSALIAATQIGQHVSCRVGTAVIVLPYHDPVILAGEIAQTDRALGGRLELGFARGAYKYEFEKLEIPFEQSLPIFIEKLEALQALLTSDETPSSFHGVHVDFSETYIWPRPLQKPTPPMWMGSQSPAAVQDAGRRGYNVLNSLFLWDDEYVATVARAFAAGREEGGHTGTKLGLTRYSLIVESESDIDARIDELVYGWRIHAQLHDFAQNSDAIGRVSSRPQEKEPSREELKRTMLIGTAEQVAEKLEFYESVGVDLVNLNQSFGAEHERVLDSTRAFAPIIEKFSRH